MLSWSCPFHSFQFPLHVPVIFSVCPLHFPCVSRSFVASHFPTSPVVPFGFLFFVFLFIPCNPLVFISVPFMSLSVPLCFPLISRCFPVMSTSYFLPSFPCTSLHFPFAPQYFPPKNTVVSGVFAKRTSKNTELFPDLRQKEAGNPSQQRAGREIRAWDSCFATPAPRRLRLDPPKPYVFDVGRGGKGGGYPLSSLKQPTRLQN